MMGKCKEPISVSWVAGRQHEPTSWSSADRRNAMRHHTGFFKLSSKLDKVLPTASWWISNHHAYVVVRWRKGTATNRHVQITASIHG